MRKYQNTENNEKKLCFKQSVIVQFETLEGAKAFLARESVKYEDAELIRNFSEDYAVEKTKEKEERKKGGEKKNVKSEKKQENCDVGEEEKPEQPALPKGLVLHFTGASETGKELTNLFSSLMLKLHVLIINLVTQRDIFVSRVKILHNS